MEHPEIDFGASHRDVCVPRGRPVLPRSKTGRGLDHASSNDLAPLAGLRTFGASLVAGSAKDLVNTHPRGPGIVCPVRLAGWRAPSFDCLVHSSRYGPSPSRRTVSYLTYFFGDIPELNSVEALAKYLCFAVIFAPFAAAFLSAPGIGGGYWNGWGISFFSEVLAFLTLTPAVLSWVSNGRSWVRRSRTYHLEAAMLFAGLGFLSYLSFTASVGSNWPALLYSLVPFLLWAALRFGSLGISSAVIIVAFLSIWGAVHGRGPFLDPVPLNSLSSIQLFLICTATPFMVLAGVVEEHKRDVEALRKTEERFRLASRAGKMFAYEWDVATDVVVHTAGSAEILDIEPGVRITGEEIFAKVHPEDLGRLKYAIAELRPERPHLQITYRVLRADGTVSCVERHTRAQFDERGKMLRLIGMVADVTARACAERELSELSGRLIHAQEEERARIARELHDDLGQRMALLQINVERLKQDTAELSSKPRHELNNIAELTSECSSELHDISRQLHPSRLDTLGLVTTLRSFCKEFSLQHNLRVQFCSSRGS